MAPSGLKLKLRRSDSNRRPSGYEPDELPLLHSAIELYPRSRSLPERPASVGWRGGWRRGRSRRRARRGRDQERALVRFRVAVQARLLLVGRPRRDGLHVLLISVVLCGEDGVLVPEVGGLLAQLVAEVRLLHIGIANPHGHDQHHAGNDGMAHGKTAGADPARCNEDFAVSHAGSRGVTKRWEGCRL